MSQDPSQKKFTPKKQPVKLPGYIYVGTPLKGEIKNMSAGEREDFLVDNLGEFLYQFCDHKKLKIDAVKKLIQRELNKLYKNKTDDKTMLGVLNKDETQTIIWNNIAKELDIMTYTQYQILSSM